MAAELVVVKGTHVGDFVRIGEAPVTIGRGRGASLVLSDDSKVSTLHARVFPRAGRFFVEDLGSTNGTYINEERVDQAPLHSGDLLKIGRHLLVFRGDGASVHLRDLALAGGGSSSEIRIAPPLDQVVIAGVPDPDQPPPPRPTAPPPPESSPPAPDRPEEELLRELVLSAAEQGLGAAIARLLPPLRRATRAGRAVVFLLHPVTGGLGCIGVDCDQDRDAPVSPELLRHALAGEAVRQGDGGAAPVRLPGALLGAVLLDRLDPAVPDERVIRLLAAAGLQLGLHVGHEQARRLAASATEIVELAQVTVQRRPVDIGPQLEAADRLFGPWAQRRGLGWQVSCPGPLPAVVDPILLGRGLDKLLEHVLTVARGGVRLVTALARPRPDAEQVLRLRVERPLAEPPEQVARLLAAEGVGADLRRAADLYGDGTLAVARVCLLRAGGGLRVSVEGQDVVYCVDLERQAGT